MFRIKTSFDHEKDDLLADVRDRNDKIFTFLQQASHLSETRAAPLSRPAREQMTPLLALQGDANALYETFQAQLCCDCTSGHSCGIAVSTVQGMKDRVATGHLKILFLDGPSRTQIKISSIPATDSKTVNSSKTTNDKLEEVSTLRRQLSVSNRLEAVRQRAPKALFELAASSIPAFGSQSPGKLRQNLDNPARGQRESPWRVKWPSSTRKRYVTTLYHFVIVTMLYLSSFENRIRDTRSISKIKTPLQSDMD